MGNGFELPNNPYDFPRLLAGRKNILWRGGLAYVAGQGPPNWGEHLERWLSEKEDLEKWKAFGRFADQACREAKGTGRAILAAAAINNAQDAEPFLRQITAACHEYEPTTGQIPNTSFDTFLRTVRFAWGQCLSRTSRIRLAGDYLAALQEMFAAKTLARVRCVLSDLMEPEHESPVLLGVLRHRVRTPVAFVVTGGTRKTVAVAQMLSVEWYEQPGLAPVLVNEPVALGCTVLDESFRQSVSDAWELASQSFRGGGYVRWSIDLRSGDGQCAEIGGNSAGGALAVALLALAEGRHLDPATIVVASLVREENSNGATKPSLWFLDGVMSAEEKIWQAYRDSNPPVRRVILWLPRAGDADDAILPTAMQGANPGLVVERLHTVREAVDHLSGRVGEIVAFLRSYANNGIARSFRAFWPPGWDKAELLSFCQPVQVITEAEWARLRGRAEFPKSQRSEGRDYVPLTYLTFELELHDYERVHPIDLERELANRIHPRILLRGEPGEGKTTALWAHVARSCLVLADRIEAGEVGVDGLEARLPLALPLSELEDVDATGTLVQAALRAVLGMAYGNGEPPPIVQDWLNRRIAQDGGYALCLDALDELDSHPAAVHRRNWLSRELLATNVPVMVTSRRTADVGGLLNNPRELRVVCFGPRQIRTFVDRYFRERPDLAREMHLRLAGTPGPRHLAQIPLLLSSLCSSMEDGLVHEFPRTRTELLGLSLRALMIRGDRRRNHQRPRESRNDTKERILFYIAWRFHAAEPRAMDGHKLRNEIEFCLSGEHFPFSIDPPPDAHSLVCEFEQDGVLVPASPRSYRFVLRSFHEYCLAGWIAKSDASPLRQALNEPSEEREPQTVWSWLLNTAGYVAESPQQRQVQALVWGDREAWGRKDDWPIGLVPFDARQWRHVWPLVAGHLGSQAACLLGIDGNPTREADLAAEAPADLPERIHLGDDLAGIIDLMFGLGIPRTIEEGIRRLWWHLGYVRSLRSDQIESTQKIEAAFQGELRIAVKALVTVEGKEAVNVLARCLIQLNYGSQTWASELARIGTPEAVRTLVECLNDRNASLIVREACADALSQFGGDDAVTELIKELTVVDNSAMVRRACALALARSGTPRAIEELVKGINRVGLDEISWACADALGTINEKSAEATLIRRLADPTTPRAVRELCIKALESASPNATPVLCTLLSDHASPVRWSCARILGQICDTAASPCLCKELSDARNVDGLRKKCADSLGQIGGDQARHALTKCIQASDSSPSLRDHCVVALVRCGDPFGIEELRERLLNPETLTVDEYEWAEALRQGGVGKGLRLLADCLLNPLNPATVRRRCAEMLGSIPDERAKRALISCIDSGETPEEVCKECVQAISNGESGWRFLLSRLHDRSRALGLRLVCASILGSIAVPEAEDALLECLIRPGESDDVREECVNSLGRIGSDRAVAELSRLLETSKSIRIQKACIMGLGEVCNMRSRKTLTEFAKGQRASSAGLFELCMFEIIEGLWGWRARGS